MEAYTYYDDLDVLCWFIGTYSEFMDFLRNNPEYSTDRV